MLFKKDNYEEEVKFLSEAITDYSDQLADVISSYLSEGEWGFLIYSLLYEASDLAAWNAKFKGKNAFKKQERELVCAYGEETGNGQQYVEIKRIYNMAFGFGKCVSCSHVEEGMLLDDGFSNTLVRGALVFTEYLYNHDLGQDEHYDKLYYTDLTNQIYMVVLEFYTQMYCYLTGGEI